MLETFPTQADQESFYFQSTMFIKVMNVLLRGPYYRNFSKEKKMTNTCAFSLHSTLDTEEQWKKIFFLVELLDL